MRTLLIATLLGIGSVIEPAATAQTLYRAPIYDNSLNGGPAYRGGGETYYQVPDNSINRNTLYDSQLKDSNGNIYNCNSLGNCQYRGF